MSLEHSSSVFQPKFITGGLELDKEWGLGCSRNIMISAMVCWCVSNFQGLLYFNF